jgi:glycosyltransferase involved in cell wall biosynthesis
MIACLKMSEITYDVVGKFDSAKGLREREKKFDEAYNLLQEIGASLLDSPVKNEREEEIRIFFLWDELITNCFYIKKMQEGPVYFNQLWKNSISSEIGRKLLRIHKRRLLSNLGFYSDYSPLTKTEEKTRTVAFLCYGAEKWDGELVRKKGIGGSEECVVYLAESLSKMGWRVTVYGAPPEDSLEVFPPCNPRYFEDKDFQVHAKNAGSQKFDVLIVWRQPFLVLRSDLPAKKIYHWSHDLISPDMFPPQVLTKSTGTVWVSEYQLKTATSPENKNFLNPTVIGNGVDISQFPLECKKKRDPYRCIYASSYVRGLAQLLDMWPDIKKEIPEASLDIYYGWLTWTELPQSWYDDMKAKIKALAPLGVRENGRIGQVQLAEEFSSCGFWLYPCTYAETFCITAVKAQLGGAIPVVRSFAGLKETVKGGFECNELKNFIPLAISALRKVKDSPKELEDTRLMLRKAVSEAYSWEIISQQWANLISKVT